MIKETIYDINRYIEHLQGGLLGKSITEITVLEIFIILIIALGLYITLWD